MPEKTVSIQIEGRVQGVGYRNWLQNTALLLGVHGWCRNRKNGAVEAVLHGDPQAVESLLEKCAAGPRMARVDNLRMETADYKGPATFSIEDTV